MNLMCRLFGHKYYRSGMIFLGADMFKRYKCSRCDDIKKVKL